MNVQEACNETGAGRRVRHDKMQAGSWMEMPRIGAGFYRYFDANNYCQFVFSEEDETADWYIMPEGWAKVPAVNAELKPAKLGWSSYP